MSTYKIEELESYKWWKRRQQKTWLECALFILFMEAVIIVLLFKQTPTDTAIQDYIFGIIALCIFAGIMVYCFRQWVRGFSVQIEEFHYGIAMEKKRYSYKNQSKRFENKAYFVQVLCENREIEGKCVYEIYKKISVGDEVIVFNIGTKEWFVIPCTEIQERYR